MTRPRLTPNADLGGQGVRRDDRRFIIRFLRDLRNEYGVLHVTGRADHHDRPREETGHWPVDKGDSVVVSETIAERRGRDHVLDPLRATEAVQGEGQIHGHANDGESARRGALVESPNAGRTHRGVDGRKNVEQERLPAKLLVADGAKIGAGQRESWRL